MTGVFAKALTTGSVQAMDLPGPQFPYNYNRDGVEQELNSWTRIGQPTATLITSPAPANSAFGNGPYRALVLGNDGKLYSPPWLTTSDILVIDPETDTASMQSFGVSGLPFDSGNYVTGALAPNGKIYFPPYNHNEILVIDPATGTSSRSSMGALGLNDTEKYTTCVLGPDGKIYSPGRTNCLVIDPATDTANTTTFGGVITPTTTAFRWASGVRAVADDKLYFAPGAVPAGQTAGHVLVIDTVSQTAELNRFNSTPMAQGMTYGGIANGLDGVLWLSPFGATNIAFGARRQFWTFIQPIGGSSGDINVTGSTPEQRRVAGAVTGDDGAIYGAPFLQAASGGTFVTWDTVSGGLGSPEFSTYGLDLSTTTQARWWGGCLAGNGKIYSLPDMNYIDGQSLIRKSIIALDTAGSGRLGPGFRNLIDTSYFNKGGR